MTAGCENSSCKSTNHRGAIQAISSKDEFEQLLWYVLRLTEDWIPAYMVPSKGVSPVQLVKERCANKETGAGFLLKREAVRRRFLDAARRLDGSLVGTRSTSATSFALLTAVRMTQVCFGI